MSALRLVLLSLLSAVWFESAAQPDELFLREVFKVKKEVLPYRILYPDHFVAKQKYPLLFVLHGSGERGNDNELQLTHGSCLFLKDDVRKKFPAIVVFPQCPAESFWSNVDRRPSGAKRNFVFYENGDPTQAMRLLTGLIDSLLTRPYVDQSRVYVGGLSMGGMGTFELLWRKPDVFAAAFVICGGGHPMTVTNYAKKVPVWIFHGAKDDVVPLSASEIMVKALKDAGANPRFTIYPDVEHDSWTSTFSEPELLPWLFSNKR
jgi:predicted peptidase